MLNDDILRSFDGGLRLNGGNDGGGKNPISESDPYTIIEQPIKAARPMRVVAIGAGIAGLALLYKFRDAEAIDLVAYERNVDVGGVWLDNRYPGCSCDIPAHIYCFSFEGNPNWTR
jgi:hypothetical protein